MTVQRYRELDAADDRRACGEFLVERFDERYFSPALQASTRHGFTLMAVSCLVIEALECFYQGRQNSRNHSQEMFATFFGRKTGLEVFAPEAGWFYQHIRCGILHQAETTGGWRVRRDGELLDRAARSINAYLFVVHLRNAVAAYAQELERDDALWKNFQKKMDAVCRNCEPVG
ncbi:MAG: hypothetical protein V4448_18230 [Pseudomonadota bacterium]